jgi:hypothetical protein
MLLCYDSQLAIISAALSYLSLFKSLNYCSILQDLLKHPLSQAFLYLKWNQVMEF